VTSARPRRGTTPGQERRRAHGRAAEDAVADFLVARGFDVLGRNVRLGALELDIVARKGDLAAIVEVRTRGPGAFTSAFESIDAKKRLRLLRGAERLWRERLSKMEDIARLRIDVASVTFDAAGAHVEYVEAALTA
jgi:putative endonuclease